MFSIKHFRSLTVPSVRLHSWCHWFHGKNQAIRSESISLCVWSRDSNWSRVSSHPYHVFASFLSRELANVATARGTPNVLWKPLLHVNKMATMTTGLAPHVRTFHHQMAIIGREKSDKLLSLLWKLQYLEISLNWIWCGSSILVEFKFGSVGFCGGMKTRKTRRKSLEARREPTTNSTHIWHRAGIEPGPHWWEASALSAAPSLLPMSPVRRPYRKVKQNWLRESKSYHKEHGNTRLRHLSQYQPDLVSGLEHRPHDVYTVVDAW